MDKTYYKVVNRYFESAWVSKYIFICPTNVSCQILNVKYKLDEWTFPKVKGSKLFVFDDIDSAKLFAYNNNGITYKCEVLNPKKTGPFYSGVVSNAKATILMWKKYTQKKKYSHLVWGLCLVPRHTVWVDAVKLIKKVDIR